MAIWQKTFHIQPSLFLDNTLRNKSFDDDGDFDDEVLWSKENMDIKQFEVLADILPKNKSWSDDIIQFGELEDHCMELLCEKEKVKSFSLRINFCSDYDFILMNLIPILKSKKLVLLDSKFEILLSDFNVLKNTIENSLERKKYLKLKKMIDK